MLNKLFLLLTAIALGITVWYMWFYESSIPKAEYQYTYALISLSAAVIFGGLWYAGNVNKEEARANVLRTE